MALSARDRVTHTLGHEPVGDGVRRVVEMRRDDEAVWFVDVGDSESDDHARLLAEEMGEDNGGGWEFEGVLDRFPHEDE